MFKVKVNDNHPADEEIVPTHIIMKQQQAAQPAKMRLASGQVVDAGRLSINFLQQDTHDVPAISQMAEEFGCIGVHIWMMTRHFEVPLGENAPFSPGSTNQRAADNNSSLPQATESQREGYVREPSPAAQWSMTSRDSLVASERRGTADRGYRCCKLPKEINIR